MARRLAERGVRFIQIYCGAENTTAKKIRPNWDSHEDLIRDHGYWGAVLDTGFDAASEALLARIVAVASGETTAAERNGEREIAIWKRGVTL